MALKDLSFENLPRSAQISIFAVLAVALVFVFHSYYMKGLLQERDVLRTEVARLEVEVAQGKAIETQHERFKVELAQLEERLKTLRDVLPSSKETPQILRSVQQTALASNLKILKFAPQPVVPRAFYADWPIQIEVEGSYNGLGNFFERVGQATRIINVDTLGVHGIDGSTDASRTLSAVCTATTFVFRDEQAAAAPKQEGKR
jgi:type IV pilus assembly protein PilO